MPQPKEFRNRLQDRVAIVTGAGSLNGVGTGKAISCVYAAEGAKVCLVDLDEARAQETSQMIADLGGEALVCAGDITKEADCTRIIAATVEKFGKLDILVNNVAISVGGGPLDKLDMKIWDRVMDVNLRAAVLMTKLAMPHLIAAGQSSIVNISSIAGLVASGGVSYGPSKAALIALTRELAMMYGRQGVRANVIAPGHIVTPHANAVGQMSEEMREKRRKIAPLGIEGDAWDIAAAALFFASHEARFITATCLAVDGGVSEVMPIAAAALLER